MDALIHARAEATHSPGGGDGQDELPLEGTPRSLTAALGAVGSAPVPLPRIRLRAAIPIDVVVFGSACPACGGEATWTEEREDTRMRVTVDCPTCPPLPEDAETARSEQPQLGRRVGPAARHGS